MFDRCQPPPGIKNPPLGLLNHTICTADQTTYEFKDGFKSFPSGHASCKLSIHTYDMHLCICVYTNILIIWMYLVSFAGLGYLSFFLAGKMHLFDEGGVSF